MNVSSSEVERLIAEGPARLPLTQREFRRVGGCPAGVQDASKLFPGARDGRGALAGLLLRVGCWAESHTVAQEIHSPEGSYWHGISHRMEPDSFNAVYWFGKVGRHAIFPALLERAGAILQSGGPPHWRLKSAWDPYLFIEWCEEARERRGELEGAAMDIQMAEWELLFNWCAGLSKGEKVLP